MSNHIIQRKWEVVIERRVSRCGNCYDGEGRKLAFGSSGEIRAHLVLKIGLRDDSG